jgi:DNA-binding NarL/FixJ family response regulator
MRIAAQRCGVEAETLRQLLYELPYPRDEGPRISEPCPLSARELDVLRHLSEGMVYKQIASEMQLSVSTIRTHLHNVYGKIGAVDRAQAVLAARDRGWI